MTGPEPATPAEAGPGGDPVPPADPVPPGDPVPPVEPAPSPDAVPAAATAAGTRALRHQFDAAAKTALAEAVTPDEPVQPVEPVGDRAGRAAVRQRHHVGGARLRAHLHPPDRPEPALVRVLVGAPGGDRAAPSALADLKGRPGGRRRCRDGRLAPALSRPDQPGAAQPGRPFAACTPDRHTEPTPLPVTAPPADYWTTS